MELEPCPKCGGIDLKLWDSLYLGSTVQCKECGWREPSGVWNTRADSGIERLSIAVERALSYLENEQMHMIPCYGELQEALTIVRRSRSRIKKTAE